MLYLFSVIIPLECNMSTVVSVHHNQILHVYISILLITQFKLFMFIFLVEMRWIPLSIYSFALSS